MTDETNVTDTLKLSVSKVIEKAQLMDTVSLAALLAAEEGGEKRSTLISWIKGEQAERAEAERRTNETANAKIYSQAEADAVVASATEQLRSELVSTGDALKLSQKQGNEDQATIANLREKVAKLAIENGALQSASNRQANAATDDDRIQAAFGGQSGGGKTDELVGDDTLRTESFDGFIPLTGAAVVLFDADGKRIVAIPAPRFGSSQFRRSGRSTTLDADIEFAPTLGEVEIAGAVLVEFEGDDVSDGFARSTLVQPFGVGGGRNAKLPAGTLTFR
ncbi:hypothetical protein ACFQ15_05725 [Sphingomonas hankookensis]|uniref:hypothetical protein n=1 Tax=Sphingomonas hankookensis TaxID=563996 RepID=UPI001F5AFDC8|nr:hypothetical protein [Sphingomonas hankookensis]